MDRWQFLDATEEERTLFPDLRSVLEGAGERVAEPNRFREVRRIDTAGTTYYLKLFHHTQHKNRLKFRLTPPRCRFDAEREWLIARALQERGIETARPVALGGRRGSSFYLCAALEGASTRTLLARGRLERELAFAAARFAGHIAASGVVLTDLSADHVLVLDGEQPRFGVLDLHNGQLKPRPSSREVLRMLRHFRRSVRGLPLDSRLALGFAARLLKAMGLKPRTRDLLARLPPLNTHGRYDAPGRAATYRERDPGRHRRELACLRRVWPGRAGQLVLDMPCGSGRLEALLEGELGARIIGVDRSRTMLRAARPASTATPPRWRVQAEATELPFGDHAFDGVVVFRFLHHLEARAARQVLGEVARVARHYLVLTFHHPLSAHGLRRRTASLWRRRAATRHSLSQQQLSRWLAELGFAPAAWAGELPYLKEFWVGAFRRRE